MAGPSWKGAAPKGIKQVMKSETEFVSVVGRTQLLNPADLENVKAVQAGYKVQPLSAFLGKPAPASAPAVAWPRPLPPAEQKKSLGFFDVLSFVLQFCPVHPSEKALRGRFAKIGVAPGQPFAAEALSPELKAALVEGMADGQKEIDARREKADGNFNDYFGTRAFMKNDYVARAVGSQAGIGANSKEEALYPIYQKDADGAPLDGSKARYTLRFAKGQLPPVKAFWSLTMYDLPSQLLVKNSINRYLINAPMLPNLKLDAEGGVTIYIQSDSPGKDAEANWLPAPKGPFMATMRYYLPKPELIRGAWKSPKIERVK